VLAGDAALKLIPHAAVVPGWSVRTAHTAARAIGSTLLRARLLSSPRQ
jgi:hypothetical protein